MHVANLFDRSVQAEPLRLRGITSGSTKEGIDPVDFVRTALIELAARADSATDTDVFRPLLVCYNPHEVHFIDELFAADVFWHEVSNGWQVRPMQIRRGELKRPNLESKRSWQLVRAVAEAFVEFSPPNVSLVMPTLSSPINIALNLFGDELLVDVLTDPDATIADLRTITDVIVECHRWFIRNVPPDVLQPIAAAGRFQPPGYGQICGCANQLVSPELYAEVFGPLDQEILRLYPNGGMIHLCGTHAQHIPAWRAMPELRSVQTNDRASEDVELYRDGLRDDQVLYVHLCNTVTEERAIAAAQQRPMVIVPSLKADP
ncbi:MAG: hypothetical protein EA382_15355 [Spirochaetaceae bacterium]|nr:MAG: hypothetical protein EA382_15355 [Spirochaetaceae bacterium]